MVKTDRIVIEHSSLPSDDLRELNKWCGKELVNDP